MKIELGAIRHVADDRLGRSAFASALALYIDQLRPGAEGMVIGLVGSWGSGKSSVIQMVLEELTHIDVAAGSESAVYYGDPGQALSRDRLTALAPLYQATSFDPLSVDLAYFTKDITNRRHAAMAAEDSALGVDLYRYYRLVAKLPERSRNLPIVFQPWLIPESSALASVFIRELARAIGDKLGPSVAGALNSYRLAVEELAPIAGAALDGMLPGIGTLIKAAPRLFSSRNDDPVTLEEHKSAVEGALRSLKHRKVVVVIDDLDRLTPKEAVEMVGLVKGLGRLPNVVYLLSYDEGNLAKLIRSALRLDGTEYLEKIVQYKRHVPLLVKSDIEELFDHCLEGMTPAIEGVALDRFRSAWAEVVVGQLQTPRDAIRLGNTFRVGWDSVGQHLDASDFLLVQFAMLEDHDLYDFMRDHLLEVCGLSVDVDVDALKGLLAGFGVVRDSRRARLLASIFPKVAEALGTYSSSGLQTSRVDRRLSAYDFRHAYFDLVAPDGSITSLELSDLIRSSDPEKQLREMLQRAEHAEEPNQVISQLLDDLRQYYGDGTAIPVNMALAIAKQAPQLIVKDGKQAGSVFEESNALRVESTIFRGLDATPPQQRADLLLELIRRAPDLSIVAAVCRTALGVRDAQSRDRQVMSMDGREDEVRTALMTRIRKNATTAWVFDQAVPNALLWFWRDSQNGPEVQQFMSKAARSMKYYPQVVEAVVSGVRSSAPPYYYENIPAWKSEIADLKKLDGLAERRIRANDPAVAAAATRYLNARQMPDHGPNS